jgi:hypothetical protein
MMAKTSSNGDGMTIKLPVVATNAKTAINALMT